MNDRRIEEHTGTMMIGGKEVIFTYHVTVIEPPPAPADINPYGEEGRCYAKPEAPVAAPAPVVEKRVPSKAEYVRSFQVAGPIPDCVRFHQFDAQFRVECVTDYYDRGVREPNARVAKA